MKTYTLSRHLALLCLLATLGALLLPAELWARTWTDTKGRTLEAQFIKREGYRVKIRRDSDGREYYLPLSSLSKADRDWIEWYEGLTPSELAEYNLNNTLPSEAPEDSSGSSALSPQRDPSEFAPRKAGAFKPLEWPRRVGVPDSYEVVVVRENFGEKDFVYRTNNFEFRSNVKLSREVVRDFGKMFEATLAVMRADPLVWNPRMGPDGYYPAQLFETREQYLQAGGPAGSGGVFMGRDRGSLMPVGSLGVVKRSSSVAFQEGTGEPETIIHETVHQTQEHWRSLPRWMDEGYATYIESVPYDDGEIRFDKHDIKRYSRVAYSGSEVRIIPLEWLMNASASVWKGEYYPGSTGQQYTSAFMLVYYFRHLDGEGDGRRLWNYVRALERGVPNKEAQEDHLLGDRTYEQLFEDMRAAFDRMDIDIALVE